MIRFQGCQYTAATTIPSWEELFGWLVQNSSVYTDEIADLGEEDVFNHYAQDYHDSLLTLQDLDGEECWRAVAIKQHDCSTEYALKLDPLGVYWSRIAEGADTYWGDYKPDCVFLYRARVPQAAIDSEESLRMNMINPAEDEIRFRKGAAIYVYDCSVFHGGTWSSDEELVELGDWRTT